MLPLTSSDAEHIRLSIKQFLTIESCPKDWELLDLYLARDEGVVFYVGQSERAFDRVWQHTPCFNNIYNPDPTPLPEKYAPTSAPITHARSLKKIIREARYRIQAEQRKTWVVESQEIHV